MKLPVHILIGCILLSSIVLIAGCTETANKTKQSTVLVVTPPTPTPYVEPIKLLGSPPPPDWAYAGTKCPIPPLAFNDSQEITKLKSGLAIVEPGQDPIPNLYPIPSGSIIYHGPGFATRIFDSTGKQILIVNDTESKEPVNGGFFAYTRDFYPPGNITIIGYSGYKFGYFINKSSQDHPCYLVDIIDNDWVDPSADNRPMIPISR